MKFKELLFTGFYSGYSPIAPGTAGTIVAALIYIGINLLTPSYGWIINLAIVAIMFYPAILLGNAAEKILNKKDPSEVVLDEMMGFWIAVAFHPFSYTIVIIGFILFRFFDILKPYPVNRMEQLKGGAGIMADDYMAGLMANLIIVGLRVFTHFSGINLFLF